jgi:putative tricarboxylic transport membrane protein
VVDRILAACTLLAAVAYLYATSTLPSLDIGDPLGPKAFPILLGSLLAVAGTLLLREARGKRKPYAGNPPLSASRPRAVAGVAIVTAVFFLLLPPLGYLIGFTSYLFVLTLWLHRRNPAACLLVSVIFAIASYLLFVKALGVALPKGILYF